MSDRILLASIGEEYFICRDQKEGRHDNSDDVGHISLDLGQGNDIIINK